MIRAKALGIDAFALNIGTDPFTDEQLGYAYASAANNGMKVFISFDFNWYHDATAAPTVGAKIRQYANQTSQLMVDGKVFASSFIGDGLNVTALREAVGYGLFWAPNFHPGTPHFDEVDAALNWIVSIISRPKYLRPRLTFSRAGITMGTTRPLRLVHWLQSKMATRHTLTL
jgi:hypothetical protein